MSKILELCAIPRAYHAVYYDPKGKDDEKLLYIDVPMFGRCDIGNGKIEVCPLIVLRTGETLIAWDMKGFVGCAEVDVNDDEYWIEQYTEQEAERKANLRTRSKKKKGKAGTSASHSRHTDDEEEEEEEDPDDEEEEEEGDEPEGEVHLSGKRR